MNVNSFQCCMLKNPNYLTEKQSSTMKKGQADPNTLMHAVPVSFAVKNMC